jgi:hypothetical protein
MENLQTGPDRRAAAEAEDLLAETRSLRRRLEFWQRMVWLLAGAVVIIGTVVWQRGELRRRECYQSLEYYAEQAVQRRLSDQHLSILEQQWQALDKGPAKVTAIHYDLIAANWLVTPKPDEELPLAVCRESHFLAMSRGRHVLYRSARGFRIEWMSAEAADPFVAEAARGGGAR